MRHDGIISEVGQLCRVQHRPVRPGGRERSDHSPGSPGSHSASGEDSEAATIICNNSYFQGKIRDVDLGADSSASAESEPEDVSTQTQTMLLHSNVERSHSHTVTLS